MMELLKEIKKPTYHSEPVFITGKKVEINFQRQTKYNWIGRTDLITDIERSELKKHYEIELSEKSHDRGCPVFDKVLCKKCKQEYLEYCGVIEFSNSVYSIYIFKEYIK